MSLELTTVDELLASAVAGETVPEELSDELLALWYAKAGMWDEAHELAQAIHTSIGSWIHALLHLIEGDTGNAGYWFRQAGQPVRDVSEIDELWREIAHMLLQG